MHCSPAAICAANSGPRRRQRSVFKAGTGITPCFWACHASGVRHRIPGVSASSRMAIASPGGTEKQTDRRVRGHQTWGLIYSSFKERWWWENAVAARKIIVAVSGSSAPTWAGCRCIDAASGRSYYFAHRNRQTFGNMTLHCLEIGSLFAVFATVVCVCVSHLSSLRETGRVDHMVRVHCGSGRFDRHRGLW